MPVAPTSLFTRLALTGIGILAIQGVLMFALSRPENLPSPPPLADFPSSIGRWEAAGENILEPDVIEMLTPDDVLNRDYIDADQTATVSLFIAYYKTQLKAAHAHDPKVCLPGSGWNPVVSKTIEIPAGESNPSFLVNYYVIAKEPLKAVVVYWYQIYDRVVAQEQVLRLNRVFDALRVHRTDMALVRIVVPVEPGDLDLATSRASLFAESIYPLLRRQFPAITSGSLNHRYGETEAAGSTDWTSEVSPAYRILLARR
jgi:EpsI family protein